MAVTEAEILKERFYEEDRRFHAAYRLLQELLICNEEERDERFKKLSLQAIPEIESYGIFLDRTRIMNKEEIDNFNSCNEKLDIEINETTNEIDKLRTELEEARQKKANRIQYDMLVKSINENPTRSESKKKIAVVQEKIEELENQRKEIEQNFELRRKQFCALMLSAGDIENTFIVEKQEEEERILKLKQEEERIKQEQEAEKIRLQKEEEESKKLEQQRKQADEEDEEEQKMEKDEDEGEESDGDGDGDEKNDTDNNDKSTISLNSSNTDMMDVEE